MQAFCIVCYFMVGYVVAAKEFFVYLAVYVMFQLTSESVGVLCAALTKDATLAVLVSEASGLTLTYLACCWCTCSPQPATVPGCQCRPSLPLSTHFGMHNWPQDRLVRHD